MSNLSDGAEDETQMQIPRADVLACFWGVRRELRFVSSLMETQPRFTRLIALPQHTRVDLNCRVGLLQCQDGETVDGENAKDSAPRTRL